MQITRLDKGDCTVARTVLETLPDWFGQDDARETYIEQVRHHPMFVALNQGEPVGFLSLSGRR